MKFLSKVVFVVHLNAVLLSLFHSYLIIKANPFTPNDNPTLYDIDTLAQPQSVFPFGGKLPSQRVHHTLVASSKFLLVFGGYSLNGSTLGDINLYHLSSQTWSNPIVRLECCNVYDNVIQTIGADIPVTVPFFNTGMQGDFPLARAEHGACVVNEEMYLFGGYTEEYGYVNDLYKFNTDNLKWINVDATVGIRVPRRRAGHIFIADTTTKQCYLFGGRAKDNFGNDIGLSDVWAFNTLSNAWKKLDFPNVNSIDSPLGRQHAAGLLMNNNLYIFGGNDPASGYYFQDLWVFDLTTQFWKEIKPSFAQNHQFSPPSLSHAHLFPALCQSPQTYDKCDGILIYGGMGGGGTCGSLSCGATQIVLGQVYLYSFTTQSWKPPFFDVNSDKISTDTQSNWLYARLSSQPFLPSNAGNGNLLSDEFRHYFGKYIKTYAMEKVILLPKQGIFFEFGGVQSTHKDVTNNFQEGDLFTNRVNELKVNVESQTRPKFLDTAGRLLSPLSDVQTGEQFRSQLDLPTNAFWSYEDAFLSGMLSSSLSKNGLEKSVITYLRVLRKFSIADRDIVLLQEDRYN